MLRHLTIPTLVLGSCLLFSSLAHADALFEEVQRDFGSVPRGAIIKHDFPLKNTTGAAMHVAQVRTSCGCATADVLKHDLAPGEATLVHLVIDSSKYAGPRTFTIFVLFDRPFVQESRLIASATSREDLSVTPSQLDFGRVKKGSAPTGSVTVSYYGLSVWQITGIDNDNAYLQPQLDEVNASSSPKSYRLTVKLREDTPAGAWHADIWLKTSDPSTPRIRIPLVVEIEAGLTATPSELALGKVKTGGTVEKKVVIRSAQPFKILRVEGTDDVVQVKTPADESKTVHVLTVMVITVGTGSDLARQLKVVTDLKDDGSTQITLKAQVTQ